MLGPHQFQDAPFYRSARIVSEIKAIGAIKAFEQQTDLDVFQVSYLLSQLCSRSLILLVKPNSQQREQLVYIKGLRNIV